METKGKPVSTKVFSGKVSSVTSQISHWFEENSSKIFSFEKTQSTCFNGEEVILTIVVTFIANPPFYTS